MPARGQLPHSLLIAADVAALPKMDVLKGWSVRSEGNASTTLSSSCAAGHTWGTG
jgi:hypothetical protein